MYATVEDLRAEGVTESDADDERLTALLRDATDAIDRATGQFFEPRELTLRFDGRDAPTLEPPVPPISIDSITMDGAAVSTDEDDLFVVGSPMQPFTGAPRLTRLNGDYWTQGRGNVRVTGTWGYVVAPGLPTAASILAGSAAPYSLGSGARLVFSVGGAADQEVTILGTAAYVETAGAGPFALVAGRTLAVRIDRGRVQTVTFAAEDFADIGSATVAELAAALQRDLTGVRAVLVAGKLRLVSDTEGLDSYAEVTGGTAAATLAFTSGEQHGTGNVGNVYAVDEDDAAAFVASGVRASFSSNRKLRLTTTATGAGASLEVKAATHDGFGFAEGVVVHGNASDEAETPRPIRRACMLLVLRGLPLLTDAEARDEAERGHLVTQQTTRDQSYTAKADERFAGLTGDPEVDSLLGDFVRPFGLGAA